MCLYGAVCLEFSSLFLLPISSFPNKAVFEEVCGETLESLTDYFEELIENADHLRGSDVSYSVS
jgi:hypothetical protein